MKTLPFEEKRNRVLVGLYELSQVSPHVDVEELEELADVGSDFYQILRYLGGSGRGWLNKSNLVVRITAEGVDRAEELIKMQAREKERQVLEKVYELGGPTHMAEVLLGALQGELGMTLQELNPILLDFERRKGWINGVEHAVWLTPAGTREVEDPESSSRSGSTTIQNVFHAPVQAGFIQGGQGHVQRNTFNNNPKVDETVATIVRLIQESSISDGDKEDLTKDVERIKELAGEEKTPALLDRVERRIAMLNTGLEAVDTLGKGGELLLKVSPYLVTLWHLLAS